MSRSLKSSLISLRFALMLALLIGFAGSALPQTEPVQPTGKTIFRDSDGNLITNDEFVDIRMANFHVRDTTVTRILPDGTVEFRLQKIPQEGMTMPDLSLTDIKGRAILMAELKGKVVVLNFWFIGCPACIYETPKLNAVADKFANEENIVFIALTYDPAAKVRKYIEREPFKYRVAGNAQTELDKFGFSGYPKNIVVGADGRIVYWRSTIKAWEKFESVITAELEKADMDDQECPICEAKVASSPRYPSYVCRDCAARTVDENGRRLKFYNESMSGGLIAEYADTGERRSGHLCYIDGIKCRADEARFGGIVITPYDAQK